MSDVGKLNYHKTFCVCQDWKKKKKNFWNSKIRGGILLYSKNNFSIFNIRGRRWRTNKLNQLCIACQCQTLTTWIFYHSGFCLPSSLQLHQLQLLHGDDLTCWPENWKWAHRKIYIAVISISIICNLFIYCMIWHSGKFHTQRERFYLKGK